MIYLIRSHSNILHNDFTDICKEAKTYFIINWRVLSTMRIRISMFYLYGYWLLCAWFKMIVVLLPNVWTIFYAYAYNYINYDLNAKGYWRIGSVPYHIECKCEPHPCSSRGIVYLLGTWGSRSFYDESGFIWEMAWHRVCDKISCNAKQQCLTFQPHVCHDACNWPERRVRSSKDIWMELYFSWF